MSTSNLMKGLLAAVAENRKREQSMQPSKDFTEEELEGFNQKEQEQFDAYNEPDYEKFDNLSEFDKYDDSIVNGQTEQTQMPQGKPTQTMQSSEDLPVDGYIPNEASEFDYAPQGQQPHMVQNSEDLSVDGYIPNEASEFDQPSGGNTGKVVVGSKLRPGQVVKTQSGTVAPTQAVSKPTSILDGVAPSQLIGKGREPTEVKGADGNVIGHVTNFGSYNRFTGTDGKVLWTDSNGNLTQTPRSMRMAQAASSGWSPSQRTAGDWNKAIENNELSQSGKNPKLTEAEAIQRNKYLYDQQTLENKKSQKAKYQLAVADVPARALKQLTEGQGHIKEVKEGPNKGAFYRIVHFGSDDSVIKDVNNQSSKMGRTPRVKFIAAAIRVNREGVPIKGAKPEIRMGVMPTGGINSESKTEIRNIDLGRVMSQYAKAFETVNGVTEAEAKNNAVSYFGNNNPLGWDTRVDSLDKQKLEEQQRQFDAGNENEKAKIKLEEAKLKESARQFDEKAKEPMDQKMKDEISKAYKIFDQTKNIIEVMKSIPKTVYESYFSSNIPMVENGEVVKDEKGQPVMKPLPPQELERRMVRLYGVLFKGGENVAQSPSNPASGAQDEIKKRAAQNAAPTVVQKTPPVIQKKDATPLATQAKNVAPTVTQTANAKPLVTQTNTKAEDLAKEKEANRRAINGEKGNARKEFTSRYKTVQDVVRNVVKGLNDSGRLNSIVASNGARRNLTPEEKTLIISSVRHEFKKAGMLDFWEQNVEEYTPQNRGGTLTQDALLNKLFKDWNNKTSALKYGHKLIK